MADVVSKIAEWSSRLEELKQEQAETRGERNALLKTLKDDFGVDSIEKARSLLKKKEREVADIESVLEENIVLFEKQYGDLL